MSPQGAGIAVVQVGDGLIELPRQRIADAQRRIIAAVRDKNAEEARKWMSKHVRDYQRGYELAGISPDTPISV